MKTPVLNLEVLYSLDGEEQDDDADEYYDKTGQVQCLENQGGFSGILLWSDLPYCNGEGVGDVISFYYCGFRPSGKVKFNHYIYIFAGDFLPPESLDYTACQFK